MFVKFIRSLMVMGLFILTLFMVFAFTRTNAARRQDSNLTEIQALLDRHDNAMNQHDLNALMELYSPDSKTVLMGTGPGEFWQGRDAIKSAYKEMLKDFDKGTSTRDCYDKTGGLKGDMAWLAAMCKFTDSHDGKKREYELNVTGVLERRDG